MHKIAMKCNETLGKWCKNKHGASKIIDTFKTYHYSIQHYGVEVFPYQDHGEGVEEKTRK
jgi:hypothetical protein